MQGNNKYAIPTITLINSAEVALTITRAQSLLTKMSIRGGYADVYAMKNKEFCKRMLLFLYMWLLQGWDFSVNALNYCTAAQMASVLSDLEQLLVDNGCGTKIDFGGSVSVQFVPNSSIQTMLIPYSFSFTMPALYNSYSYQNNNLKGLQDLVTVFMKQGVYQINEQFTYDPVTGTLDFTLSGWLLQPGDTITGNAAKLLI